MYQHRKQFVRVEIRELEQFVVGFVLVSSRRSGRRPARWRDAVIDFGGRSATQSLMRPEVRIMVEPEQQSLLQCWGSQADAEAYLAKKLTLMDPEMAEAARAEGLKVRRYHIPKSQLEAFRKLDLRPWSDADVDTWLQTFSRYGRGRPHGFDYVIRGTGMGEEHFFSGNVFRFFREIE
jgi:hypothetical protein